MKAYTIKWDIEALKHERIANTALKVYQELINNGFSVSYNHIIIEYLLKTIDDIMND